MLLMIFWHILIVLFFSSGLMSLCAKEAQKRPAKQTKMSGEHGLKKSSASTDDKIEPQKKKSASVLSGTPNAKTSRGTKGDDDGEYEENANVESVIEVKQVGDQIIYIKNGEVIKVA
ncbi:unnamed protein product [Bursaphelenchus xylophilus]|uniref:(pine wood nematode) hypothetical protein n=1 Tax=Bursaphelenchus xylophilus TaxID=6326 RepID=A0A1I7RP61_BURXY|nr:unnamed protein product [Bursaphelenchus xylophilus]CAG9124589.1 unnamed protein product [Bursaphelenchus xylophilus]